jgi:hypothetical protein
MNQQRVNVCPICGWEMSPWNDAPDLYRCGNTATGECGAFFRLESSNWHHIKTDGTAGSRYPAKYVDAVVTRKPIPGVGKIQRRLYRPTGR